MEITSNVIGKLKKIKDGISFSDNLVVVTEIIQNSQRAKAKNVHISLKGDTLTFKDDGCGCKKPENILTLDYSEWDSTDEGFGIGLWSWLAVPEVKSVEIMSHNWKASISTEELFVEGNPRASISKLDGKMKGFKVSIKSSFFLDELNASELKRRVFADIKTQILDGYFNEEPIPKIDLHAGVESVFTKYFSTNYFQATLGVDKYSYPSLYYENREVRKLYSADYVSGVVEMRKNALILQEPDRKNYVFNEKSRKFEERLAEAKKELYLDFIKEASESDINNFAETIDRILDVTDYERLILADEDILETVEETRNLNFTNKSHSIDRLNQFIDNTNLNNKSFVSEGNLTEDDVLEIQQLLNKVNEDDKTKWVSSDVSMDIEDCDISADSIEDYVILNIGGKTYKKINIEKDLEIFSDEDEEITTKNILSVRSRPEKEKKSLSQMVKSTSRKVWVRASESEKYKDLISKAEYYKVKVFMAKNILEERVFEHNNISYITEIDSGIQKKNFRKDVCLKTNKERYFIELLQPILEYYNLPMDTFKIGYLKMYIETILDDVVINREIIENKKDRIRIWGVTDGNYITLDRRAIGLHRFNLTEGNIGINEIKALMANLKTISHELAHLIYETEDNTKYHFQMEDRIYEEIVNLYLTI